MMETLYKQILYECGMFASTSAARAYEVHDKGEECSKNGRGHTETNKGFVKVCMRMVCFCRCEECVKCVSGARDFECETYSFVGRSRDTYRLFLPSLCEFVLVTG